MVEWFDLTRDGLLRYLLSLGLPIDDCEEIAQETFLALVRHLKGGKPRENLRGWIFCVGRNLALKRRIRARRDGQNVLAEGEILADPNPNPEAACFANQTQARLEGVLRALPEVDRSCVILRAEGLTYREISAALDLSLGTVANSLTRSLGKMARFLEVVAR